MGCRIIDLEDTIDMMESDDFRERFRAEYYQLKIRTEKLSVMLEKYKGGTLKFTPKCSYELLHEQYVYMKRYMDVLSSRAVIENIDLEE